MPAAPDAPAYELTEDKVLRIKYADRWTIAWKCVLDDNNNVTDLLPAHGLPDGDQAPYTTYPLASFLSLERASGSAPLSDVAADAVRAFHARQLESAGEDILALDGRGVLRGVVVSSHRTEVVCDVYENARGEELPIAALTYNGSEWRGSLENLDHARRLPLTRESAVAAARLPAPTADEWLSRARHALQDGRERRKALCRAFAEKHVVAQVDTDDFARCHVLLRRRVDRTLISCLLRVEFSADFPARPPTLYLREYGGKEDHRLDTALYRYSPRWDVERMSQELRDHACSRPRGNQPVNSMAATRHLIPTQMEW